MQLFKIISNLIAEIEDPSIVNLKTVEILQELKTILIEP
jgi:hypothetical protein